MIAPDSHGEGRKSGIYRFKNALNALILVTSFSVIGYVVLDLRYNSARTLLPLSLDWAGRELTQAPKTTEFEDKQINLLERTNLAPKAKIESHSISGSLLNQTQGTAEYSTSNLLPLTKENYPPESSVKWDVPPNLPWVKKQLLVKPETLMSLSWVKDLQAFLVSKVDKEQPVVLVSSNMAYRESLLNWLIHSMLGNDTMRNILVLSMDVKLHSLLQKRRIHSLLVIPSTLAKIMLNKWRGMLEAEVVRLFAMRLINLWGYDVINYDSDAIVIKNPQSLFDLFPESDVIGSEAFMPRDLHDKWGVTLCMGVVLLRASPATERFWAAICSIDVEDDQKKLNYALQKLDIHWSKHETKSQPWHGVTRASINLTVTVLPMDVVCRGTGCNLDRIGYYHVWHQGGLHNLSVMIKRASKANVWLLRKDWESLAGSGLTAQDWLREISYDVKPNQSVYHRSGVNTKGDY